VIPVDRISEAGRATKGCRPDIRDASLSRSGGCAIVLNDLGSSAIMWAASRAGGRSRAPWFILAVMLFSYAFRAFMLISCAMFTGAAFTAS